MSYHQFSFVRNLTHDTLYQGRFTFTVLSYKGNLLAPIDGQGHIMKDDMIAVRFLYPFADNRIIARTYGWRKFQPQSRVVFFINLNRNDLLQLLDTALYLYSLCRLVTETFDKIFCILYFFLLILISAQLLFATFLAEYDELVVRHFIIINSSARNLNGPIGYIINKRTVVTYQYHSPRTHFQKILQPLNTFYIQMVGRLVQQQDVRTAQQQLCQFDTHTPAPTELAGRTVKIGTAES